MKSSTETKLTDFDNQKPFNELTLNEQVKIVNNLNKVHTGEKFVQSQGALIINIKGVEKYFTNGSVVSHILKGVDLEVKRGEFVVILGKSGSGKTTLLNIISGLFRASKGSVIVNNFDLINLKDHELVNFRRNHISYIFQEYGLLSTLNVYENIKLIYSLNAEKRKSIIGGQKGKDANSSSKKFIYSLLESTGLLAHKKKFPYELSGGQQQRVAICRALAKQPKIVFADEPTGALDSKMSAMVLDLLKKVNKEQGTTVVLITHDSKIAEIADKVVYIREGLIEKVVENKPQNPHQDRQQTLNSIEGVR